MRQGRRLARVVWTADADRSFEELISYLREQQYGDADRIAADIRGAIDRLRYFPERCAAVQARDGRKFRRLNVRRQLVVYYIYFAPRVAGEVGRISIRAVRHGARRRPLAGVREELRVPGMLPAVGWWID